jgi:spore maturation protein CgeB
MRLVIFGLTVSSSWGNGHAPLWRGLIRALVANGHQVTFFERDTEWYAGNRDLHELPPGGKLVIYPDWASVLPQVRRVLVEADAAVVTSYCPDGVAACRLVTESAVASRCFYDMDTPVTLARLAAGENVGYVPPEGLGGFGLVLSFTGGGALQLLRERLGARHVAPFHGWVDPDAHRPGVLRDAYAASLSYLGTYAADRQAALETLLIEPARARPEERFVIGGAQYPTDFPWAKNIFFVRHLPPSEHPDFYASCRLTLNVTRGAMSRMGWCPSGRLFEAASCGAPILSDRWVGLEDFFVSGREILAAQTTAEALEALSLPDGELAEIAARARARVLDEHTAQRRAHQLVAMLESASATNGAQQEA